MARLRRRLPLLAAGVLALALAPALPGRVSADEGFGTLKKTRVSLVRKKPPRVYIEGAEIAVRVTDRVSGRGQTASLELQKLIESRLLNADTRLRASASPETVVDLTIVKNQSGERAERRKVTGLDLQRASLDDLDEDKLVVDDPEVDGKVLTYELSVAYKVVDLRSGATLDSNTYTSEYNEWFQEGRDRPTASSLELERIEELSEMIAERLAPSVEEIIVLVPRGRLKDLGLLAEGGLWSRYLEAVERLPPAKAPKDESYRQYALGLAHEALAYQTVDPETSLRYLHQAALHYSDAITANPAEEDFILVRDGFLAGESKQAWLEKAKGVVRRPETLPPLQRIQVAVADYAGLAQFQSQIAEIRRIGSKGGAGAASAAEGSEALDNAAVIEMVRAGLPENIILQAIDSAEARAFDTSPRGLIELSKAGVSAPIIERLQSAGGGR